MPAPAVLPLKDFLAQEVSIAPPVTVSYTKAVTTVYERRRENYAEGMGTCS